jgi:PleD family two-component response regulator
LRLACGADDTVENLVVRADDADYQAKRNGRNQVV